MLNSKTAKNLMEKPRLKVFVLALVTLCSFAFFSTAEASEFVMR